MKRGRDTSSIKNDIPRSVTLKKESITTVDLHSFSDSHTAVSCAIVYAVVHQSSVKKEGLVISKSHMLRKYLMIETCLSTNGIRCKRKCKNCIETLRYKFHHWVDRQYSSFALVEPRAL